MLTTSIVNKILHVPTVKMKEVAGRDQCYLYVDAVRTLFDLDADEAKDEAMDDDVGQHATAAADGDEPSGKTEEGPPAASGGTVHQLRGTGTEDA